jgi:hypothetical protein
MGIDAARTAPAADAQAARAATARRRRERIRSGGDRVKLEGSCHCGAVRFRLESSEPVPYMRCYCSICRKTAGGGGYAINLGGDHRTFEIVQGRDDVAIYQARLRDGGDKLSPAQRHFCKHCGSALWLWDPRWPALVHPHASAIDTPLPLPPATDHIMLGSKANWVEPEIKAGDRSFDAYPDESLAQWHRRHGVGG